jgi:phosphoenolpyruvate carboxykinase (GTP)
VPTPGAITLDGLDISQDTMRELLHVDSADWTAELAATAAFFKKFGDRLPAEIWQEHAGLARRLEQVAAASR